MANEALFKLGYGLYVVTTKYEGQENGCVVNTVMQLTSNEIKIGVCINKGNYTHEIINKSKHMIVNCLTEKTPFSVIQNFGFKKGREENKLDIDYKKYYGGIAYLAKYSNAYLALKVESSVDLDSHTLFICTLNESEVLSEDNSLTYDYYFKHVKPAANKKASGYTCEICGYVYEGDELPEDFVCPLCAHGPEFFKKNE